MEAVRISEILRFVVEYASETHVLKREAVCSWGILEYTDDGGNILTRNRGVEKTA